MNYLKYSVAVLLKQAFKKYIFFYGKDWALYLEIFAFSKYCFYQCVPLELCLFKTTFKLAGFKGIENLIEELNDIQC